MRGVKELLSRFRWRRDERRLPGLAATLPRRSRPLHLNFVFHAENIADERYWPGFLDFATRFRQKTNVKPIVCVVPGVNPLALVQMARYAVSTKEYADRVRQLQAISEVGYHGHFFTRADSPRQARETYQTFLDDVDVFPYDALIAQAQQPIGKTNEDLGAIRTQFARELEWFVSVGMRPRVYAAGMWFLSRAVTDLLDTNGFAVDTSIRQGHTHPMGGHDLPSHVVPERGAAFLLPPHRRVIEIQSLFYPVEHPARQLPYLREILLRDPEHDAFAVFPSHETEVHHFGRAFDRWVDVIHENVTGAAWTGLDDMLRLIP